jgi:hypothetical protein
MKTLSEALADLSTRVAKLEESASAAFAEQRGALEQRRHEIDGAVKTNVQQLEDDVRDGSAAERERWNDLKTSIRRHLDETRAQLEHRKAERLVQHAQRAADKAEHDAAAAVALATYCVNAAEYAVIDAALARMTADDLIKEAMSPTNGGEAR